MNRCLLVFSLDAKLLEKNYHNACWRFGYSDVQQVLKKHRFKNVQGTVYLSDYGVRQAHGVLALQEVAIQFPWFEKCVSDVHIYNLADSFNGQFIVDGVAQVRENFELSCGDGLVLR